MQLNNRRTCTWKRWFFTLFFYDMLFYDGFWWLPHFWGKGLIRSLYWDTRLQLPYRLYLFLYSIFWILNTLYLPLCYETKYFPREPTKKISQTVSCQIHECTWAHWVLKAIKWIMKNRRLDLMLKMPRKESDSVTSCIFSLFIELQFFCGDFLWRKLQRWLRFLKTNGIPHRSCSKQHYMGRVHSTQKL